VAEAARFNSVAGRVHDVLTRGRPLPAAELEATLRSWKARSAAGSTDVAVKHLDALKTA
jgi:hypothetical protein